MKFGLRTLGSHSVKHWFKEYSQIAHSTVGQSVSSAFKHQVPPARPQRFSIHKIYAWIFKIWRRKRFVLFVRLLSPQAAQRLIVVGGYPEFWAQHPAMLGSIETLNLDPVTWDSRDFPEHHIQVLVGDGCALEVPDKSYDIAFSNSVIEHVGSWSRQEAFASEMRRVGKAVWVQTPAFECPIESHYLAPFVHWVPGKFQRKIIRWLTPWGWISRPSASEVNHMVQTLHLLTKHEMQVLFPDCRIYTERLLGFIPKSYIAVRKASD